MALVFISPKKRKKVLIQVITGLFIFILIIFGLVIFLRPPEPHVVEKVFEPDDIEINFDLLDSEKLNNLDLFQQRVVREFSYEARTGDHRRIEGKILAFSQEEARERLENLGLSRIEIEERKIGRVNPFSIQELEEKEALILTIKEKIEQLEDIIEEDHFNQLLELEEYFLENPDEFWDLVEEIEQFPELAEELIKKITEEE